MKETLRKFIENLGKKRGVSYSYRTATTSYLCFVPDLEDSEGAGRTRLTPATKVIGLFFSTMVAGYKFDEKGIIDERACSLRV